MLLRLSALAVTLTTPLLLVGVLLAGHSPNGDYPAGEAIPCVEGATFADVNTATDLVLADVSIALDERIIRSEDRYGWRVGRPLVARNALVRTLHHPAQPDVLFAVYARGSFDLGIFRTRSSEFLRYDPATGWQKQDLPVPRGSILGYVNYFFIFDSFVCKEGEWWLYVLANNTNSGMNALPAYYFQLNTNDNGETWNLLNPLED